MSEQVGAINVKIDADVSGLNKGTKRVKTSLNDVDKAAKSTTLSTDKLSKSSNSLGNNFGNAATAAFALAGGLASIVATTGTISRFDDSMLGLKATISGTAEQMVLLEDQARKLGASTIYSADQAAGAQRFLAQAGFDVNEVLSATPGILNIATAGALDLAAAADLSSNVLGGFSLEVSELSRVSDVLALSSSKSNTNISQLGIALSYVAPLANTAGITIEETAAAIGVLSDSGIQGSRAGTGLIGVIRSLSKITPMAESALEKYGLTSDDVNIKTNGLQNVLKSLKDANIDTSDSFVIFGSEANAAASVLANGNDRVLELTDSLNNANGSAEKMASTMASGVSASLKGLQSALQEVILVLGDQGGKSGIIGLSSVATSVMRDLGSALDYSSDQASDGAKEFKVFEGSLRGVAIIAKSSYETISSMAASVSFLAETMYLAANGEFKLIGKAWDDYNEKVKENISQTEFFYKTLYPSDEQSALNKINEELDEIFDAAERAESALNKVTNNTKSNEEGGNNSAPAGKLSAGSNSESSNVLAIQEELKWKKELAAFDAEGRDEENEEKDLEASQRKLEAIQEYFKSDLELLNEAQAAKQYAIDEALINEQLSQEEHEILMTKLQADGAAKRKKLKEAEGASTIQISQNIFGTLSSLMNTNNKRMFEIGKAAAMANAAIDGSRAVISAWRSGMETPGPFAPVVAAAYAGAALLNAGNLMNNISSQSFGGGSSASVPMVASAQPQAPTNSVGGGSSSASSETVGGTLKVEGLTAGALFSGEMVAQLADELLDYQARGGNVVLA